MATRTAGQLASIVKQLAKMDLAELGENPSAQNSFIFDMMSFAMQKWARLAYNVKVSDPLNITADGYVTFQINGSDITDMFEPLRILDPNGQEVQKRTSFTAPKGWWVESANTPIHVKGLTPGNYTLHYIKYPDWITSESQVPDWPPSGYMGLIYETIGQIKESKNFYDEANNYYAIAQRHLKITVMANEYARGTTGGRPPTVNDVDIYMKG